MQKFNVWALSLSIGIIWGAASAVAGWCAALGWGEVYVHVLSSAYVGYGPSFLGGLIGGIWGFFDGGVFGLALGFLYNYLCGKKKTKKR